MYRLPEGFPPSKLNAASLASLLQGQILNLPEITGWFRTNPYCRFLFLPPVEENINSSLSKVEEKAGVR